LRSIAVVFHLHNFGYNDRRAFADPSAVLFPSEYSRRHHAQTLGLDGPVIPDPIPLDRVVADNTEPKYVTFINPQPAKNLTVFARTAMELNQRRPGIPFLSRGPTPIRRPRAHADAKQRSAEYDSTPDRFHR
jgi:hypothetical protein